MFWLRATSSVVVAGSIAYLGFFGNVSAFEDPQFRPEAGCSFRVNRSEILSREARIRRELFERSSKFSRIRAAESERAALPRRNFIDDAIFSRLEQLNVVPAPLSTDEEFVRRIYLDLTGRIPAAEDVRNFLADNSPGKRDALIEKLLYSAGFNDKWTVWLGDLLQNVERLSTNARAPQIEGRNSFALYLADAMANHKPIRVIAQEVITAKGNNYFTENGAANYAVLSSAAMGPAQDTYDMMFSRTATAFLGMAHYDCLLCHSGRGHLEAVSLWGQRRTRSEAQKMAAHFSRMRLNNGAPGVQQNGHPLYNSTEVTDAPRGQYDLNTNSGNRPRRLQVGDDRSFTPEYRDGSKPAADANWRAAFAEKLVSDPMFGRNFASRLWKEMFGLGLVDPVDTLDPDRLDPANPPPAPLTLQASHPELLEKLAQYFVENGTDLRAFLRLLVQSTAYQLSADYRGEWKYEYVNLFARHYPRRLQAEEVHDAIAKATGVLGRYTWPRINGQTVPRGTALPQSDSVAWAMQLPDPSEPRNNAAVREFMRSFYRGNRDTAPRTTSGAILQQLNLMNDQFVTNRVKVNASPVLREIARIPDEGRLVEELFLTFLSRRPSGHELETAVAYLARNTTTQRRNMAVEDLAWACINKMDFLFSY